jgi:ASC-1-like (ASCH) protein
MDHLAIMKKSWGLTEKILSGEKKIESRWYKSKRSPWDKIKSGERVYFKNSGEPVKIVAKVAKVLQFSNLTPKKVRHLLEEYGNEDGINTKDMKKFFKLFKAKNYCILVFLKNPSAIKPFSINKKGYGMLSSWISVENIRKIRS